MDTREAINTLISSPLFAKFESALQQESIFDVLAVGSREISHAAFLRWLLDPQANHGAGVLPLKLFLHRMESKSVGELRTPDAIEIDLLDLESAAVETEVEVIGTISGDNQKGRVDILITLPSDSENDNPLLVFEHKVWSTESGNQTEVYAAWAKNNPFQISQTGVKRSPLMVYVCPDHRAELDSPAEGFQVFSYSELSDWLDDVRTTSDLSDKAKFLIDEYKSCLIRQDLFASPDADDSKHLLESDVKCHQTIEYLKTSSDKLKEYTTVINRHSKAFIELDIKKSKTHSKGHSATILFFKDLVVPEFSPEQWYSGGRSGCAYFDLLATPRLAKEITKREELTELSTPYIQFYVTRPENNSSGIYLYGGTVGGDKELKKPMQAFVKELCSELRKHLRDNPKTTDFVSDKDNTNNIASISLEFTGIKEPEDDTEILLSQHETKLTEASHNMLALKEAVEGFDTSIIKDLLSKHLLGNK